MRMVKFAVPFILALIITAGAQAGEKGMAHLVGEISAKPADAKAGVVAVLTTHGKKGKDGAAVEGKKYNLVAEGEVAKSITDMIGKKAEVTGSGDEAEYKVTACTEPKKKAK